MRLSEEISKLRPCTHHLGLVVYSYMKVLVLILVLVLVSVFGPKFKIECVDEWKGGKENQEVPYIG